MGDEATTQLQRVRLELWVLNAVMMAYLLIWLSWGLTTWAPNRHSYGLSTPAPGVLVSDHWSPDHMLTMVQLFFFLVPWTLAFMSDAPRKEWRQWTHFILVILFFFLAIALLGVGIWHISNANAATADNALNPANDERWCCLYATLNPEACAPISGTNPCAVVPPASLLSIGFTFMWSFAFLIGWILLLLSDFVYTYYRFGRAVLHYETMMQNAAMDVESARPLAPPAPASVELYKNQLPFHIRRQHELLAAAAGGASTLTTGGNANKKYAGRSNKR